MACMASDGGSSCRSFLTTYVHFHPVEGLVPTETLNPAHVDTVCRDIAESGVLNHPIYVVERCDGGAYYMLDGHNRKCSFQQLELTNILVQKVDLDLIKARTWIQLAKELPTFLDLIAAKGLYIEEISQVESWRDEDICTVIENDRQYLIRAQGNLVERLVDCTRLVTEALAENGDGKAERFSDDELNRLRGSLNANQFLVEFQPRTAKFVLQAAARGERVGAGATRFIFPRVLNVNLPIGNWLRWKVADLEEIFKAALDASSPRWHCPHILEASLRWPRELLVPKRCASPLLESRVGNTPLVPLANATLAGSGPRAFGKCEFLNLEASSKARTALQLIIEAPAGELLDAGSGGTAQAEARIAKELGRQLTVVVPEDIPKGKMEAILSHGATVLTSPAHEKSEGARRIARELHEKNPGKFVFLDQYSNDANWRAHLRTADEIFEQTNGLVTDVFAGIGTGGTTRGIALGLKARNPRIRVWGVMPASHDHKLYGLKFVTPENCPPILDLSLLHDVILISDPDAYDALAYLHQEERLPAGPSSGSVYAAWLSKRQQLGNSVAVLILHDHAGKYGDEIQQQIHHQRVREVICVGY